MKFFGKLIEKFRRAFLFNMQISFIHNTEKCVRFDFNYQILYNHMLIKKLYTQL